MAGTLADICFAILLIFCQDCLQFNLAAEAAYFFLFGSSFSLKLHLLHRLVMFSLIQCSRSNQYSCSIWQVLFLLIDWLIAATPLIVATFKKFRKDEALSAWHQIPSNIRPCSAFSYTIWWDNGHLTKLAILSYINHNLMTDDSLSILLRISTWTRLGSSHSSDDFYVGPSPLMFMLWLEEP